MNIGIYLTPDLALPFLMVEIIIAEKNEVITIDKDAKILKSDCEIPVPLNFSGMPTLDAAFVVPPREAPRFCTTSIKTPYNANRSGAATTAANVMNIV